MSSILVIPPPPTRIYRVKLIWKAFAVALLLFAIFCPVMGLRQFFATGTLVNPLIILVFIAVLALTVFLCFEFFTAKVECTMETVSLKSILKTQTLPVTKIRGRREVVETSSDGNSRFYLLESNDPKFKSLKFEKRFQFDAEFYAWFNSLPDLDAER